MPSADDRLYAAAEVAHVCAHFRKTLAELVRQHPELAMVAEDFDEVVHHAADPLQEASSLFDACQDVFIELRHLINPIGLPVHLTEDGRVLTRTFQDVSAFVTDIRGFTEMTQNVETCWGVSVFDVLSTCYFPHVVDVLERHECHYLNYTGDGLLVLSRARHDEAGRVLLPSLDNAALCALELTAVTNAIAETWKRMGLVQRNGVWHETGLGLTYGAVQVGDPFVPDGSSSGKLREFDERFRAYAAQAIPFFQPRREYNRRVVGIHALSPVINRASRLQDADKVAPQYNCMMTADDVARLCPVLRQRFAQVGTILLKGIGETEVFGADRYQPLDIPALARECQAYYVARRPAGAS